MILTKGQKQRQSQTLGYGIRVNVDKVAGSTDDSHIDQDFGLWSVQEWKQRQLDGFFDAVTAELAYVLRIG